MSDVKEIGISFGVGVQEWEGLELPQSCGHCVCRGAEAASFLLTVFASVPFSEQNEDFSRDFDR
jgi:hypothetical protein